MIPHDLTSDANILLVHEPDYRPVAQDPGPPLGHLSFVSSPVHRAMPRTSRLSTRVESGLGEDPHTGHRLSPQHPHAEICFTGHSLGAALAVLAFSRFADPDISLYTFGCPRIGDAAFRDRVLSNTGKGIYRLRQLQRRCCPRPTRKFPLPANAREVLPLRPGWQSRYRDSSFKGDVQSLRTAILGPPGQHQGRRPRRNTRTSEPWSIIRPPATASVCGTASRRKEQPGGIYLRQIIGNPP